MPKKHLFERMFHLSQIFSFNMLSLPFKIRLVLLCVMPFSKDQVMALVDSSKTLLEQMFSTFEE